LNLLHANSFRVASVKGCESIATIGAIFNSAMTCVHHVARIRRRFGARSEMLSMLRAMLAPET
jgi:hypothetical protein